MKTTINLNEFLPAFVSSRKSIKLLKDNVSLVKGGNYVINFEGISFVSRSFADEFIKFFNKHSVDFSFENMNTNLQSLFSVVQKTQQPKERHFDTITITSFKRGHELNGLLASL